MATNTYQVTQDDDGVTIPLRGDMAVNITHTPNPSCLLPFVTQDTGTFVITSAKPIRSLTSTPSNTMTVGGKIGLSFMLQFDAGRDEWAMTLNNLTGTGSTGTPTDPTPVELGTFVPDGGAVGQVLGKTGTDDGQVGWVNQTGGGGTGEGGGFSPEVELTQDANGDITPNATLGENFRVLWTKPGVIKDPVGYPHGKVISIALRQATTGPFPTSWGLAYAHPDRQNPILGQEPGALSEITAKYTASLGTAYPEAWMTKVSPDKSTLGYGVPSYIARNVTTGVGYYVMRSPDVPATECAMTAMKPGETLKILRNGRGVEAYGAIVGSINGAGSYVITGVLDNGQRAQLYTGTGVRTAFDRGILGFDGAINVTVQDLILSGARSTSVGFADDNVSGITLTGAANVTIKNVLVTNCPNGVLTGATADYQGTFRIEDSTFDGNSIGHLGFTHNVYMGEHIQPWYATRTTFKNAEGAHNIKTRSGDCILDAVHTYNSKSGRELDCPNGGQIHANDCIFEHLETANQNDCVSIGQEGVITSRPREYIFRNCHFINRVNVSRAASFIRNLDTVSVQLIDCTFEGATQWADSDNRGMIGPVTITFTPGVTPGPRVPVGDQSEATTPVVG